jgi:uncharacterized protein YutE (UPF0331/DUF86 family)
VLLELGKPVSSIVLGEALEDSRLELRMSVLSAIALHICRNIYGLEPETPIHALKLLADKNFIQRSLSEELVKIIKLRNLLVHRYWVVDDKIIYDAIKKDFKYVEEFIKRVLLLVGGI